jgi:hypothetical protein
VEADPVADLPERQAVGAELTDFLGALGLEPMLVRD